MWHSLVVVASLLTSTGVQGQQEQQSVFLLGHHFDQYASTTDGIYFYHCGNFLLP